jgi:hypothetical protein
MREMRFNSGDQIVHAFVQRADLLAVLAGDLDQFRNFPAGLRDQIRRII